MIRNKILSVVYGVGLLLILSACGESDKEKKERIQNEKSGLEMTIRYSKLDLTKILANYYGCQKLFNIKLNAFNNKINNASDFYNLEQGFEHVRQGMILMLNNGTAYECTLFYDEYSFPENPTKYKISFNYFENRQVNGVVAKGYAKGKIRGLFSRENINRINNDFKKHTYYSYSPNSASSNGIFTPDIIEKINSDLDLVHRKYEQLTKETPETKKQIESDIQKLLRGDL